MQQGLQLNAQGPQGHITNIVYSKADTDAVGCGHGRGARMLGKPHPEFNVTLSQGSQGLCITPYPCFSSILHHCGFPLWPNSETAIIKLTSMCFEISKDLWLIVADRRTSAPLDFTGEGAAFSIFCKQS